MISCLGFAQVLEQDNTIIATKEKVAKLESLLKQSEMGAFQQ